MIDHTGIEVEDMGRSAAFYDAALGALGFRRAVELPRGRAPTVSAMNHSSSSDLPSSLSTRAAF